MKEGRKGGSEEDCEERKEGYEGRKEEYEGRKEERLLV
jgi:hypothetical protein